MQPTRIGTFVLPGDSIFDNGAYVGRGRPDVRDHLMDLLGDGWSIDLRAVDGATAAEVKHQLPAKAAKQPCHAALSMGGNDALLRFQELMNLPSGAPRDLLLFLREIQCAFRADYRSTLDRILEKYGRPLVCTIYNPVFDEPEMQQMAEVGLSIFNDVIVDEALARGLPMLDLRRVCADRADFANQIEPSASGGRKIAEAIVARLGLGH